VIAHAQRNIAIECWYCCIEEVQNQQLRVDGPLAQDVLADFDRITLSSRHGGNEEAKTLLSYDFICGK